MGEEYSEKTTSHQNLIDELFADKSVALHVFQTAPYKALLTDAFKGNIKLEPIYASDGSIIARESLARPKNQDLEDDIEPQEGFSIAELCDFFYSIGLHVEFDTFTSSLAMKNATEFPITLNISVKSALTPEFFDGIKERKEKYGLNPEDIIFEILEHDVDLNADTSHLEVLKEKGFRFALDDFSVAQKDKKVTQENRNRISVFGHLINFVKIDGPLVRAYFEQKFEGQNRHGENKTYFTADFQEALCIVRREMRHAQIIAERVSTKREANQLFEIGIAGVQGRDLKPEYFHYTQKHGDANPALEIC